MYFFKLYHLINILFASFFMQYFLLCIDNVSILKKDNSLKAVNYISLIYTF